MKDAVRHPALLLDAGELLRRARTRRSRTPSELVGQADRRVRRLHPRAVPQGRRSSCPARRSTSPSTIAADRDVHSPSRPASQALADGKLDAFLCSSPSARPRSTTAPRCGRSDTPAFFTQKTGYVDRHLTLDPGAFLDRIDAAIADLHASGKLKALSEQYFGMDYATTAGAFDLASIGQTGALAGGARPRRERARRGRTAVRRATLDPARPPRPAGRVLPPAVRRHGPRRRRRRLRARDGRPDERRLRAPRRGRRDQGRRARPLDRRADAGTSSSSGAMPGFGDDARAFLDPAASDADRSARGGPPARGARDRRHADRRCARRS